MQKQLLDVGIFHETYGQPVLSKPKVPSMERCVLRYELIREELQEFREAYEGSDIVASADALIDLLYVVHGAFHEFGLGEIQDELFDEVQNSNMLKLDADGNILYHPNGKVKKSELFKEPDLKSIILKRLNNI